MRIYLVFVSVKGNSYAKEACNSLSGGSLEIKPTHKL